MPLLSNSMKYLIHIDNLFVLHYPQAIAHDRNHIFCSHAIHYVGDAAYWLKIEYIRFKQLWNDMMKLKKMH